MILAKIRAQLEQLRPSERRVAEAVLARPTLMAGASIKSIAAAAEVSEPTVMRFCRAIGCVGVQDLKQQLARDLGRRTPIEHASGGRDDDIAQLVAEELVDRALEAVLAVRAALAPGRLRLVLAALSRANRYLLWGFDAAGRLAEAAAPAWFRDGLDAAPACDPQLQLAQARASGPDTAILLLSAAGPRAPATLALADGAEVAQARGARLVGLLPEGAALLQRCDAAIPLPSADLGLQPDPGAARLAPLLLLDVLRVSLALRPQRERQPDPVRPG